MRSTLLVSIVLVNVCNIIGTQKTVYRAGDEIVEITRTKITNQYSPLYAYYAYSSAPQYGNDRSDVVYYTYPNDVTTTQNVNRRVLAEEQSQGIYNQFI